MRTSENRVEITPLTRPEMKELPTIVNVLFYVTLLLLSLCGAEKFSTMLMP
jgi:hypothetical protein